MRPPATPQSSGFTGDCDVRITRITRRRPALNVGSLLCTQAKSKPRPDAKALEIGHVKEEEMEDVNSASVEAAKNEMDDVKNASSEAAKSPTRPDESKNASSEAAKSPSRSGSVSGNASESSDESSVQQPAKRRIQVRLDTHALAEVTRVPIYNEEEWNELGPATRFQCAQKRVAYWSEQLAKAAKELRKQ